MSLWHLAPWQISICFPGGGLEDPHPPEAILISGTSNMTFQALAASALPDLAAIKGSQQTRAMPRLQV